MDKSNSWRSEAGKQGPKVSHKTEDTESGTESVKDRSLTTKGPGVAQVKQSETTAGRAAAVTLSKLAAPRVDQSVMFLLPS